MSTTYTDYKKGVPHQASIQGALSLIAAATPVNLYLLSADRTAKVRKLRIFNHNAAATDVVIGTLLGVNFVQMDGPFHVLAGFPATFEFELGEIQDVEYNATITCSATVAGAAPNNVELNITVEEFPGATG